MPKQYKRKRQIGYSSDANYNRKSLNSSERWRAKREIVKEIDELTVPKRSKKASLRIKLLEDLGLI